MNIPSPTPIPERLKDLEIETRDNLSDGGNT
jgi:hypothetical protein